MGNFTNTRSDKGYSRDNRGFEKPQMHPATCSKCGKSCMVPFKPTGNRPIFCSDCFKTESANLPRRTDEKPSSMSAGRTDRMMFDAICDKCGSRCQIPFQPRPGKQVFCSHCFEQKEKGERSFERPQGNNDFTSLNAKLDKIIELLSPKTSPIKVPKKEAMEEKAIEVIEMPLVISGEKKVTKKAPVKKKASPKKTVV